MRARPWPWPPSSALFVTRRARRSGSPVAATSTPGCRWRRRCVGLGFRWRCCLRCIGGHDRHCWPRWSCQPWWSRPSVARRSIRCVGPDCDSPTTPPTALACGEAASRPALCRRCARPSRAVSLPARRAGVEGTGSARSRAERTSEVWWHEDVVGTEFATEGLPRPRRVESMPSAGCRARSRRRPGRWRRGPTGRRGRSSPPWRRGPRALTTSLPRRMPPSSTTSTGRRPRRRSRAARGSGPACRRGCCRRGWTPRWP